MDVRPDNPLIVQSDHTVLLEVDGPRYADARDALAPFAELVKSPEHIHTYRVTPLSIWNAAAAGPRGRGDGGGAGFRVRQVRGSSKRHPGHPPTTPPGTGGCGCCEEEGRLVLTSEDELLMREACANKTVAKYLIEIGFAAQGDRRTASMRGHIKQAMIKLGYPVEDLAGYVEGGHLALELAESDAFRVRPYQAAAVDAFWAGGTTRGGSGVVVLPCGAGKTIVAMAAMAKVQRKTLIVTTNLTAVRQWQDELRDKCTRERGRDRGVHGRDARTSRTSRLRPTRS